MTPDSLALPKTVAVADGGTFILDVPGWRLHCRIDSAKKVTLFRAEETLGAEQQQLPPPPGGGESERDKLVAEGIARLFVQRRAGILPEGGPRQGPGRGYSLGTVIVREFDDAAHFEESLPDLLQFSDELANMTDTSMICSIGGLEMNPKVAERVTAQVNSLAVPTIAVPFKRCVTL